MAVHPPALVSVALSQHRTLDRITARCTAHPSYLYLTKAGWGWSQLEQGHHQRKANGESGTSVIKAGRQAVAVSRLPPACRSITRGSPAFSHSQRYKSEPAHPPSQDLLRSPTSLPIATPPPPLLTLPLLLLPPSLRPLLSSLFLVLPALGNSPCLPPPLLP